MARSAEGSPRAAQVAAAGAQRASNGGANAGGSTDAPPSPGILGSLVGIACGSGPESLQGGSASAGASPEPFNKSAASQDLAVPEADPAAAEPPAADAAGTARLWLSLHRGSLLQMESEVQDMFQAAHDYINPLMICGRLRTGKSYLLNALLGDVCFGVSSQARSFTQGVEVCPRLLPSEHFSATPGGPRIAMVDLEGHCDKGMAQDVKLATPVFLISKAVILLEPCPVGPAKESILESLQIMMRAAEFVADKRERKDLFGCLHIVLRDCHQDEAECHRIIFGKESDEEAPTDEQEASITRRNKIRAAIAQAFETEPRVWCLPKIAEVEAPADYRDASPEFARKIDDLRQCLGEQLATPKLLDSRPLTGGMIAQLMPAIAEALKNPSPILNPPALMERVGDAEVLRAGQEIAVKAEDTFGDMIDGLPMAPTVLRTRSGEARRALHIELCKRIEGVSSPAQVQLAQVELTRKMDAMIETLSRKNGELLSATAEAIQTEMYGKIKQRFDGVDCRSSLSTAADAIRRETEFETEQAVRILPASMAHMLRRSVSVKIEMHEAALASKAASERYANLVDESARAHETAAQDMEVLRAEIREVGRRRADDATRINRERAEERAGWQRERKRLIFRCLAFPAILALAAYGALTSVAPVHISWGQPDALCAAPVAAARRAARAACDSQAPAPECPACPSEGVSACPAGEREERPAVEEEEETMRSLAECRAQLEEASLASEVARREGQPEEEEEARGHERDAQTAHEEDNDVGFVRTVTLGEVAYPSTVLLSVLAFLRSGWIPH